MPDAPPLSLNARTAPLVDALLADQALLRIQATQGAEGETVIDCGLRLPGGTEAGLRLARICLGGLAEVALLPPAAAGLPPRVLVRTGQPALACLGSQYAGWHLRTADGGALLGSGPARALAGREPLFGDLPHREAAARAVLVLEGEAPPDGPLAREVAEACRLAPSALTLLHAPTGSLAGTVQIAARVVECAVQKARHRHFPLDRLVEALGEATVAPPHPDPRTAMGRANDAIIHGGRVRLAVLGPAEDARELAQALPSRTSPAWGRPFAEVFDAAGGDFAHIDPDLFSPAQVTVTSLESGETFRAGRVDARRLRAALA